jgi:hypothetical protein
VSKRAADASNHPRRARQTWTLGAGIGPVLMPDLDLHMSLDTDFQHGHRVVPLPRPEWAMDRGQRRPVRQE